MDTAADEFLGDDNDVGLRDRPCKTCRRRKVRCSKTEPCTNCQRANIVCEYPDGQGGKASSSVAPGDLARRVAELEALVRRYRQEAEATERSASAGAQKTARATSVPKSPFAAERIVDELGLNGSTAQVQHSLAARSRGKLVVDGSRSRHVLDTFWPTMYEEVDNLKFLLAQDDTKTEPSSDSSWILFHEDRRTIPPISLMVSPAQSEYLVRAYISNVDQSVRVLHKPSLLKQVNFLWRGVLPDFQDFECQLAVIYCLALLSLSPEDCETHLGRSCEALAKRFHAQAERGIATLSITTTHKLASLQTFVLYITYLSMSGQTVLASSMLAMAIRAAHRMGVHRDGTHYNLNPWQTEIRRRLWHHVLLLDTWCMEQHGLESAVSMDFWDTKLPLNANDADWNISEYSNHEPPARRGFTDNSLAFVQYEIAALIRLGLDPGQDISEKGSIPAHASQLQERYWNFIDDTYLAHLDSSQAQQRLVLEVAGLTNKRVTLMNARISIANGHAYQGFEPGDDCRMLSHAVDYCKHIHAAQAALSPANLDWVIMRSFCWHSLMTMLSLTLRKHGVSSSADAQWALQRLMTLFEDRQSIEFLRSNETMWQPIKRLLAELDSRYGEISRQIGVDLLGSLTS